MSAAGASTGDNAGTNQRKTNRKEDAVVRMIAAEALADGETLRVRIFPQAVKGAPNNSIPCLISDGIYHIKGRLIGNAATLVNVHDDRSLIIAVESFVSSHANVKEQDPLVYISSLSIKSRSSSNKRAPKGTTAAPGQKRIQGGIAPSFLHNFAHVMSDDALSGVHQLSPECQEHIKRISKFLAHHSAMTTIHAAGTNSPAASSNHLQDYVAAWKEFQASQMDRQKISLNSNCGREGASRSSLIAQQHVKALQEALNDSTSFMTPERLCAWHGILCGEGIHEEAGRLRTKAVRVGHVHFRHYEHMARDLKNACNELQRLETRFMTKLSLPESREKNGLASVTLAAAVMFSILDIHGFADGNGRLGRIGLNWSLRRFGVPFVINLFASPGQRREYTAAIVKTRRNLALVGRGHCSELDVVHALEEAGAFAPMVELIADRLSKTIGEFEKIVEEKSKIGVEEAELRAAKRVRDRERAGTCVICFDENPNIATLCCGKAVHLNCVATWLSSASAPSCPTCREQFPALSPRVRAPPVQNEDDDLEETEDDTEFDTMEDLDELDDDTTSILEHDDYVPTNEEEQHALESLDVISRLAHLYANQSNSPMQGTSSHEEESEGSTLSDEGTTEDDTNMVVDEEEDGETTTEEAESNERQVCCGRNCRNIAALDCSNGTCGRCCQLYGRYHCDRHNT